MKRQLLQILGAALCVSAFTATAPEASAYSMSHFTATSAMTTGHWVKIRVDHEGLYEITYDQLRQWGFANPESVTVYGFGGTMLTHGSFYDSDPDDLTPTVCFHLDKALRFYGIGAMRWLPESYREINLEQNIYSNYGYYFVSDVKPEAGEDKVILRESSGKLATAVSAFYGVTEDVENLSLIHI